MPNPWRTRSELPQAGQADGAASVWPQVRQRSVRLPNSARVTSQRGHSQAWPQWSQTRYAANPRRFRKRMALSPASTTALSAPASCGENTPWWSRMSTISSEGGCEPSTRWRRSAWWATRAKLSTLGVAEPRTTIAPVAAARQRATVRAS